MQKNTTLQTISIPKSVTVIFPRAFEACSNLTVLNYTGTKEEWGKIVLKTSWAGDCSDWIANKIVYNYKEPVDETE